MKQKVPTTTPVLRKTSLTASQGSLAVVYVYGSQTKPLAGLSAPGLLFSSEIASEQPSALAGARVALSHLDRLLF